MTAPPLIRPLSDAAINEIAAGEVIERPVSIVKELIENSLDAGAVRIVIDLTAGGIERIQIRDDGHGIAPDQLHLALARHCTSKLIEAAELAAIRSLGFRGEALASIAAVAEVSIISRTAADTHGWRIDIGSGDESSPPRPQPHPLGTTVEIRHLFAKTPARRRFLKRPRTEFLHIQQFLRRAGFCYPEVAFHVIHNGRQGLSLPAPRNASAVERRWRTLFGREFTARARVLDVTVDALHIRGWVGERDYSRQNSDLQTIAVNRRIVRDRHIAHAVRLAYDHGIEDGRYAAYALHLELPAEAVDVNVHPGKAEVRFHDPRTVHDLLYAAVKQALDKAQQSPQKQAYAAPILQPDFGVAEGVLSPRASASHRRGAAVSMPHLAPAAANLMCIVADRFALFEHENAVMVMDLHRAIRVVVHSRLTSGERDPRPLIIPEALKFDLSDQCLAALLTCGIEIGRLGEERLALRSIPVIVSEVESGLFGTLMAAALVAGANEIDAIASAAAAAFRAPRTGVERGRWFATLGVYLAKMGRSPEDFSVIMGTDKLSRLFDPGDD